MHIKHIAAGIEYKAIWWEFTMVATDGVMWEILSDMMVIMDISITTTMYACHSTSQSILQNINTHLFHQTKESKAPRLYAMSLPTHDSIAIPIRHQKYIHSLKMEHMTNHKPVRGNERSEERNVIEQVQSRRNTGSRCDVDRFSCRPGLDQHPVIIVPRQCHL